MAGALIKELENKEGKIVYPVSVAQAIFMPGTRNTVLDEIKDLRGVDKNTTFNADGTISEVFSSGKTITTTFKADGSIEERCTFTEDGALYYTKTTIFNADGSITETIVYAE